MKTTRLLIGIITISLALAAHAQSYLTNGLLAYYPFSGNANDASGNGYNGTNSGATLTTDRFGIPNGAFYFNGTSSSIALPQSLVNQLAGTNAVSLSVWFQAPTASDNQIRDMVEIGAGQNDQAFILDTQNGGQLVYSEYGNDYNAYSQVFVADGAWHQGAAVYSNGAVALYVDGIQRTNVAVVSDRAAVQGVIGENLASSAPRYYWLGSIDDVRFYNRALSSNEVAGLYAYESSNSAPSTVTAASQTVSVVENTSQSVTLSGASSDGGTLAYTVVTPPTNGTLSGTAPNLTYQPATNYTGSDSFTFQVSEGTNTSPVATVSISVQPVLYFLTNGLLAYYPFSGNANDASGNGNNATNFGAALTTNRLGVSNAAYYFNGINNWITLPQSLVSQLAGTNAVSVSVWFQAIPASTNLNRELVQFGAGLKDEDFVIGTQNGGQYIYSEDGNDYNQYSGVFVSDGAWHQGATVYNGGTVTLYVDGIQRTGGSVVSDRAATAGVIGENLPLSSAQYHWLGSIDDVRFYNRGLSSNEVAELYAYESSNSAPSTVTAASQTVSVVENTSQSVTLSGSSSDGGVLAYTVLTPPTNGTLIGTAPNLTYQPATNYTGSDSFTFQVSEGTNTSPVATVGISVQPVLYFLTNGLLAYYPFSGDADDASGNGYNATNFGATLTTNRLGVSNAAYYFNGINNWITLPQSLVSQLAGTNAVSVSVWFQAIPASTNLNRELVQFGAGLKDEDFVIGTQNGGQYIYSEDGNDYNQYSGVFVSDGAWHQGATVYNGGTVTLYVDGIQRTGGSVVSDRAATAGVIGENLPLSSAQYHWLGSIDDVRFYNRALSSNEVAEVCAYESSNSVPMTGPPFVIQSPASQTVSAGTQVSFSALADGSPSSIQWYVTNSLGTNPVVGATSSPLVLTANDGVAGGYEAVFSNSYGMATTAVAVLSVVDPPVVATSPASQTANAGAPVTFIASNSGGSAAVQWYLINYLGTNAVSGATSPTLTVTASGPTAGGYFAVFNNSAGSATTGVANFGVLGLPFVNGSFEINTNGATIPAGGYLTLNIGSTWMEGWTVGGSVSDIYVFGGTRAGCSPYDGYQWIDFNGFSSAAGGKLAQTFTTTVGQAYAVTFEVGKLSSGSPSVTATAFAANGALLASNYCAPTVSMGWSPFQLQFTAVATNTTLVFKSTATPDVTLDDVVVLSPPAIVSSPASQTVTNGGTVTFAASASGTSLTVQWFQGTNSIPNATNTTLTFTANSGSGGYYTAVFTNAAGSAATTPALLTVDTPVFLTQQPQSVTTWLGANVTLAGAAGGDAPILFQWQFDGANIVGATNATLALSNVQLANAGNYVLLATNASGWAASSNAVLSIVSTVQVASTNVAGAGTVTIPVNLIATGNEAAVGFSLDFDSSLLTCTMVQIGSSAFGGFNTNQAPSGHIGIIADSTGTTFSPGTQEIAEVTFSAALVTSPKNTTITFSSSVVTNQVSDALGNPLAAVCLPGTVAIATTVLKGDVAPRPNGDGSVTIIDWVQEGRFVAGLDTCSNTSEFLRADCAPRATGGDGVLDASDWVQVGRYALGLDPLTAVTNTVTSSVAGKHKLTPASPTRQDISRIVNLTPVTQGAATNSVMVQLLAKGDEQALRFSLAFDPNSINFVGGTLGPAASGAKLFLNTTNLAAGELGVALGFLNQTFQAGTNQIVNLTFSSVLYSNTVALVFTDAPVAPSMSDSLANPLSPTFQNGSLVVGGAAWPVLDIAPAGGDISLSWPASGTNMTVQMTTNFPATWSAAGGTPVTNGSTISVTLPAPTNATYYRLYQP